MKGNFYTQREKKNSAIPDFYTTFFVRPCGLLSYRDTQCCSATCGCLKKEATRWLLTFGPCGFKGPYGTLWQEQKKLFLSVTFFPGAKLFFHRASPTVLSP
jgi:hypothetical protein